MASSADQIIAEGNVEKVEAMQALIDRLTERCEAYKGQVETGASELNRLTAEVERLRAIIKRIVDHYDMAAEIYTSDAELAAGMADIARQRL